MIRDKGKFWSAIILIEVILAFFAWGGFNPRPSAVAPGRNLIFQATAITDGATGKVIVLLAGWGRQKPREVFNHAP